ncbi:hypothetical protein [Fredinandcohnia quinoae]|nr:hypothetical protein [Fredinandcohnia sp. SECRCQ15]
MEKLIRLSTLINVGVLVGFRSRLDQEEKAEEQSIPSYLYLY